MSSPPVTIEALTEALNALVTGTQSNEVIQQVQKFLSEASKSPAFVVHLATLLTSAEVPAAIRHLSAILLRKKITTHWSRTDAAFRDGLKSALLGVLVSDPESAVRRSVGHLVAVIAKHTVPQGKWPELLPFLHERCKAEGNDPRVRVAALEVFASMADSVSESLAQHATGIAHIFLGALQDADPAVRRMGLRAFGATVPAFVGDATLDAFAPLVPPVLEVITQCVSTGDDDVALEGLEVVHELLGSPGHLMRQYVPGLIEMSLQIGAQKDVAMQTRERFLATVEVIAEYRNGDLRKLCKQGAVEMIARCAFSLLVEPPVHEDFDAPATAGPAPGDDDNVDGDESEAYHLGTRILSSVANELPSKYVYPVVSEFARMGLSSGDMPSARAGLLALGVISEGCEELIKADLPALLPAVFSASAAPSPAVREAAVTCLALMAESLVPEVLAFHNQILPFLLNALGDEGAAVRSRACYGIEVFCEELDEEIIPYLEALMNRFAELLHSADSDTKTREMVVSAIGATAAATGDKFAPYFDKTMQVMGEILQQTDDLMLSLRARAMECVGCIALAMGRQRFEPYVEGLVKVAVEGLELDFYELREYTFGFFSNLALLLRQDIVPLLPHIIPALFESIESDDITYSSVHDEADGAAGRVLGDLDDGTEGNGADGNGGGNGGGGDNEEDEDDDEDDQVMTVRTAFLDEKATAIQALGIVAKSAGPEFIPFVGQSMQYLMQATRYFHTDVRVNAVQAVFHVAELLLTSFPSPHPDSLSEECGRFVASVFQPILMLVKSDESRAVVAVAASRLAGGITLFGRGCLSDAAFVKKLYELVGKMFRRKTLCQRRGLEDDEEEEDDVDQDAAVINGAGDLVIALANALRGDFVQDFGQFLPHLLKFTTPSRSTSDRIVGVATIAQVVIEMGPAFAPHAQVCLRTAVPLLGDSNIVVQRNAAFCVGSLVQNSDAASAGEWILPALQGIAPLLACPPGQTPESMREKGNAEVAATRDNAASCLARLLGKLAEMPAERRPVQLEAVLSQALPPFCSVLPLCSDKDEERPVYTFFAHALSSETRIVPVEHTQVVLEAVARIVGSGEVDDASMVEAVVAAAAAYGARSDPAVMGNALRGMGEAERGILMGKFGWQA